jgi:hypothetical protein
MHLVSALVKSHNDRRSKVVDVLSEVFYNTEHVGASALTVSDSTDPSATVADLQRSSTADDPLTSGVSTALLWSGRDFKA